MIERTYTADEVDAMIARAVIAAEPTCPECKAALLYECVACSSNNYPPQGAQEPEAWGFRHDDGAIYDCISPEAHAEAEGDYTVPLYTTPPQKPWVGLTNEEIDYLLELAYTGDEEFLQTVEAALQSKNT